MNEEKIRQAFDKLIVEVKNDVRDIYKSIYEEVRDADPELLASKITMLESRRINNFCMKLDSKAEQTAKEAMKAAGVPEVQAPMIWVKVRNIAKAPNAKMCNEQKYTMPHKSAQNSTAKSTSTVKDTSSKPYEVFDGKSMILAGAIVEIASWIWLPSLSIWAVTVKGVGLILMFAGFYKVAKKKRAESRIPLTEEAKKMMKKNSYEGIEKICTKQCELNTSIYVQWMRDLSDQLIAECANYEN